ncbi:MAG: hypothetical protein KIPDCIKN_00207 [Haliscomenobacter sp.]|jgi:hypothetical protein|nr:hypothetical protein [Haliscomenobacter sp.]
MNIRKIKLALTIGLMNLEADNLLQGVKDLMQDFTSEVGAFLGLDLLNNSRLNNSHVFQQYALQYEHATVKVDVVANPFTKIQVVQNFSVDNRSLLAA